MFRSKVDVPLGKMSAYGVKIHMGLSSFGHMDLLIKLLASGRVDLAYLATQTFSLRQALEAYDLFENHKDQSIKVLLKP
jgi:threonine dehydrogenase-like Zn-dependent dehydrogenase